MLMGSPLVAITSRNAGSVRTRTVGSALYNMTVQAGSIISSNVSTSTLRTARLRLGANKAQIYRTEDAPYYRTGNKVLLGIIAWTTVLIIAVKFYYKWRNASRDKIWSVMTPEQRDEYLRTTKDQGNKRLDFRFAH